MRSQGAILILALIFCSRGALAAPPDAQAIRKALEAEYAKRATVLQKRDLPAFAATMTTDFIWESSMGVVRKGKAAYLDLVKLEMDNFKPVYQPHSVTFHIDDMHVHGDRVAVMVTQHDALQRRDKQGQTHKMDAFAVYQELWRKTGPGWKFAGMKEVRGMLTRDGKVVNRWQAEPGAPHALTPSP
ncbi:MAG TPA: nuclear transport factor 2 family protein [Chthonomonadaceae bacterium]|nr:nuclear transport factor 2 family protein [Chthonomonadaceae bacterium]